MGSYTRAGLSVARVGVSVVMLSSTQVLISRSVVAQSGPIGSRFACARARPVGAFLDTGGVWLVVAVFELTAVGDARLAELGSRVALYRPTENRYTQIES